MYFVKYGEEAVLTGFKLITAATFDFQANPTLASGDVKLSKDGGALTNLATLPDAFPASSVDVRVQLSAAETTCRIGSINFIDQTGSEEWKSMSFQFFTFGHPSAYFAFDFSMPTVALSAPGLVMVENAVWESLKSTHTTDGTFGESTRLSVTEREAIANILLDLADTIESSVSLRGALRLILASCAGTTSGMETGTLTIKNPVVEDKDRIVMVTDANNNRVSGTWDQT